MRFKLLSVLIICVFFACENKKTDDKRTIIVDELFEDNAPDSIPEILAPGIISNGFHEHGIAISPQRDEILWVISDYNYQLYTIIGMKKVNDNWTSPEVVSFSGEYTDHSPCFDHTGEKILFASKRPTANSQSGIMNIWSVTKTDKGWGTPIIL